MQVKKLAGVEPVINSLLPVHFTKLKTEKVKDGDSLILALPLTSFQVAISPFHALIVKPFKCSSINRILSNDDFAIIDTG